MPCGQVRQARDHGTVAHDRFGDVVPAEAHAGRTARVGHTADLIVTTEKDLVKLEAFPFATGKLVALRIAPEVERAEQARGWFRTLRGLAERHDLRELSMGMSGDFEVAIEEGATLVRVGTAVFGPRPARA